jgi:hypothetical protein
MEDQPVEVVGDVGQDQFRLGTRDTDCADKQPEAVLLMREDMLDRGADRGLRGVCPREVNAGVQLTLPIRATTLVPQLSSAHLFVITVRRGVR